MCNSFINYETEANELLLSATRMERWKLFTIAIWKQSKAKRAYLSILVQYLHIMRSKWQGKLLFLEATKRLRSRERRTEISLSNV